MSVPRGSGLYKLPTESRFFDLSDYARPLATRFVAFLLPYHFIGSITVTLSYAVVGLVSAGLIWHGQWMVLAALLLPVKSFLDAADGSLARARNRPSQVGRFLDSFCDFLVNLAVFTAIAHHAGQSMGYALAALLLATFQGSVYNYYYVIRRHAADGDLTSIVDQRERPEGYPWDHPGILKFLHGAYVAIYWWQDRLAYYLDPKAVDCGGRLSGGFLTALSVLGLGFQLLMICLFLLAGEIDWILFYFTVPSMAYTLGLVAYRRFVL